MKWYFNLATQQVEPEEGGPNAERMGPYDTREEAENALASAAARNEEFDADED